MVYEVDLEDADLVVRLYDGTNLSDLLVALCRRTGQKLRLLKASWIERDLSIGGLLEEAQQLMTEVHLSPAADGV